MKSLPILSEITFSLIVVSIIIVSAAYGQKPGRKAIRDKIEAQEIAFITQKVNLTSGEAQQFWPVYNEFREKKKKLNKDFSSNLEPLQSMKDKLTEEQCKSLADSQFAREQKLLDLKKEYHTRFLSILPASKVLKLYQADREFKKILLKRLGDQRKKGEFKNASPDFE
ncbi:MAG: hypothetical protein AB9842_11265 [Bacteroidales bacterium]